MLACGVPPRAVSPDRGQTAMVRERDEGSTAAGLALVILVTQSPVAPIKISPDFAGRDAHWRLKFVDVFVGSFVLVEGLAPGGVLADGGGDAKFFLAANVDTLGRAGPLRHPRRVDMRTLKRLLCDRLKLVGLLLEVLKEGALEIPVEAGAGDGTEERHGQRLPPTSLISSH